MWAWELSGTAARGGWRTDWRTFWLIDQQARQASRTVNTDIGPVGLTWPYVEPFTVGNGLLASVIPDRWAFGSGTIDGNPVDTSVYVVSNHIEPGIGEFNLSPAVEPLPDNDQYAKLTVTGAGATTSGAFISVRASTDGQDGYQLRYWHDTNGYQLALYRAAAGVLTLRGSILTVSSGVHTIELRAIGNQVFALFDGLPAVDVTDTTYPTNRGSAILLYNFTGADAFTADDFEEGVASTIDVVGQAGTGGGPAAVETKTATVTVVAGDTTSPAATHTKTSNPAVQAGTTAGPATAVTVTADVAAQAGTTAGPAAVVTKIIPFAAQADVEAGPFAVATASSGAEDHPTTGGSDVEAGAVAAVVTVTVDVAASASTSSSPAAVVAVSAVVAAQAGASAGPAAVATKTVAYVAVAGGAGSPFTAAGKTAAVAVLAGVMASPAQSPPEPAVPARTFGSIGGARTVGTIVGIPDPGQLAGAGVSGTAEGARTAGTMTDPKIPATISG